MSDLPPLRRLGEIGDIDEFLDWCVAEEQRIPIVPCDSPIEDIFLWEFHKVANDDVQVRRQHYCNTSAGAFRLDFVLSPVTGGLKIGIECDGRDFHRESTDSRRDAAIISAGVVEKIYRLRGRDIYFRIHDALHLLSLREPWLFSHRGHAHLEQLSAPVQLREDVWGVMRPPGFPYGILRRYLDPSEEFEEVDEQPLPRFPTLICWTQRDT